MDHFTKLIGSLSKQCTQMEKSANNQEIPIKEKGRFFKLLTTILPAYDRPFLESVSTPFSKEVVPVEIYSCHGLFLLGAIPLEEGRYKYILSKISDTSNNFFAHLLTDDYFNKGTFYTVLRLDPLPSVFTTCFVGPADLGAIYFLQKEGLVIPGLCERKGTVLMWENINRVAYIPCLVAVLKGFKDYLFYEYPLLPLHKMRILSASRRPMGLTGSHTSHLRNILGQTYTIVDSWGDFEYPISTSKWYVGE